MSHRKDAPLSVISLVWSVAALLAIFFAVIISSFFVLKYYFPVSAEDVSVNPVKKGAGNCSKDETTVALHNYPGTTAINNNFPKGDNDYQHGVIESLLGGNYQCTEACIPGIDSTKSLADSANRSAINKFLEGAIINGVPVKTPSSGDDFIKNYVLKAKDEKDPSKKQALVADLKSSIIVPYAKSSCAGYNSPGGKGQSVDYQNFLVKGQPVKKEEDNNTAEQADTAEEQRKAVDQTEKGPSAILPPPKEGPKLPTSPRRPTVGGPNQTDLLTCKTKISDFIEKYQELLDGIEKQYQGQADPNISRFEEIKTGYKAIENETDSQDTLNKCHNLQSKVEYLINKLWGSKTVLASCKTLINNFLTDNGKKRVQEPAYGYYKKVESWYKLIKYHPYYRVSSERSMKLCENAKSLIQEYKVATGTLAGPVQATERQKQINIQMSRLNEIRGKNLTYRINGWVWWNLSKKQLSNRAVVCVANTRSNEDGTKGEVTRMEVGKDGFFQMDHVFNANMLGERGVDIYIYDPGATRIAKSFLYHADALTFNEIVLNQVLSGNTSVITASLGNINLQEYHGGAKALRDRFEAETGNRCD